MHKSKLSGFIIDCQTSALHGAASFWAAARGMPIREFPGLKGESYQQLIDAQQGLDIEVQTVDHASRVLLDIESDDVEAGMARLEGLGAKRIAALQTSVVMQAPTGQRFCGVRAGSAHVDRLANQWP